jgi:predicted DNA-binding ribbon-helix-helix protein
MPTTVKKRSVVVAGHRTSVSLEAAFWDALREIAQDQQKTLNQLVSEIDRARTGNLSSAIRVHVLYSIRNGRPAAPSAELEAAGKLDRPAAS